MTVIPRDLSIDSLITNIEYLDLPTHSGEHLHTIVGRFYKIDMTKAEFQFWLMGVMQSPFFPVDSYGDMSNTDGVNQEHVIVNLTGKISVTIQCTGSSKVIAADFRRAIAIRDQVKKYG